MSQQPKASAATRAKFEHEFYRIRRVVLMAGAAVRSDAHADSEVDAISFSLYEAAGDLAALGAQVLNVLKAGAR